MVNETSDVGSQAANILPSCASYEMKRWTIHIHKQQQTNEEEDSEIWNSTESQHSDLE